MKGSHQESTGTAKFRTMHIKNAASYKIKAAFFI